MNKNLQKEYLLLKKKYPNTCDKNLASILKIDPSTLSRAKKNWQEKEISLESLKKENLSFLAQKSIEKMVIHEAKARVKFTNLLISYYSQKLKEKSLDHKDIHELVSLYGSKGLL